MQKRRIKKKAGIRRRDVLIFIGCLVGVILSFQSDGSVSFKQAFSAAWLEGMPEENVANLPKPILVDLDGATGQKELIAVTALEKLTIYKPFRGTSATGYVQDLEVRSSTHMQSPIIGFSVGNLHHTTEWIIRHMKHAHHSNKTAQSHHQEHHQEHQDQGSQHHETKKVIAVVCDDYTVTLFDSDLHELWAVKLPVPTPKNTDMYDEMYDAEELYDWFLPTSAMVTVLPNKIYLDDVGSIIIGVEMELPLPSDSFEDDNVAGTSRQLSYFALNGHDGALRWMQNTTDEINPSHEAKVKAQHSYKLTLQHLEHHSNEQDWRYYRRNIIASLPHSYTHSHDAKLQLHRFAPKKNRKKKGANHKANEEHEAVKDKSKDRKRTSTDYGTLGDKVWSLVQWRKKRAMMPDPNVIVVHRQRSIEALHLYTGKTLAQVGPLREGWLYEDVNDDSVIDGVTTLIGDKQNLDTYSRDWGSQTTMCKGVMFSGAPYATNMLHNHSICVEGGLLHNFEFLKSILKDDDEEEGASLNSLGGYEIPGFGSRDHFDESVTAAPPLAVHRHIQGSGMVAKYRTDVLYFISSGLVTCLNGKTGKVRWHADTDSLFGRHASGFAFFMGHHGNEETAVKAEFREKAKEVENAHAHLKAYSLYTPTEPHPTEDVVTIRNLYNVYPTQYILAVGAKRVSVLNSAHGQLEHEFTIDSQPMAPVIVEDFNNDGINDLLFVTKGGLVGYLGVTRRGATVITATLTCVMALLALLFLTHRSVGPPSRRLARSTD